MTLKQWAKKYKIHVGAIASGARYVYADMPQGRARSELFQLSDYSVDGHNGGVYWLRPKGKGMRKNPGLAQCVCGGTPKLLQTSDQNYSPDNQYRVICPVCGRETKNYHPEVKGHATGSPSKEWNVMMAKARIKTNPRRKYLRKSKDNQRRRYRRNQGRITEHDIVYEKENYWVARTKNGKRMAYVVFKPRGTVSISDSAYALTPDGKSIATARCNYLATGSVRSK